MESVPLNVKRSQSDNLAFQSKIVSPSPIRKTSKISLNLAKELFDLPSSLEETDSTNFFGNPSNLYKSKFFSLRTETESPKYTSSPTHLNPFLSSLSLESSCSSSVQDECESPKPLTRSYLVIDELEEAVEEIVPRASNPIVNDINFMRCNQ